MTRPGGGDYLAREFSDWAGGGRCFQAKQRRPDKLCAEGVLSATGRLSATHAADAPLFQETATDKDSRGLTRAIRKQGRRGPGK